MRLEINQNITAMLQQDDTRSLLLMDDEKCNGAASFTTSEILTLPAAPDKKTVMNNRMHPSTSLTRWLANTSPFWFSVFSAGAAFCLYTCVYALRKTFSAATFEGLVYLGISYKVWIVTFQVIGYALSKFIGIRVIAELKREDRKRGILTLTVVAGISWLLFALVPSPYNMIFPFINGLTLGMIWGMVFAYLEGRRVTEVLGAGLSVSLIFSSGFVKSVGGLIMANWDTSQWWMPFVTSCLFAIPLGLFLWLLDQLPPPSAADELLRTKRKPMNATERWQFVLTFWPGIILFILCYMFLTAFRDFRDNFSAEIWETLGFGSSPEIFTTTEIPASLVVLVIVGCLMRIKSNKTALMINHVLIMGGLVLVGVSTALFEQTIITAPTWMATTGLGLYLGYVPFNSIFFDRLLAAFRYIGTVGFVMYLADSFGYLASVGVLFYKEFGQPDATWLGFMINSGYWLSGLGLLLIGGSMIYFHLKHRHMARMAPDSFVPGLSFNATK
jgi:hypothetical protein